MTKTIELPVGKIVVTIDYDDNNRPISGNITHDLKDDESDDDETEFNAAMDGICSLVLGHAMAEIDVESKGYIEGLETAISACDGNF